MNEIEKVTTIQDAITWFELDLKDGKCYDTCPQCNANEFALAALREQAEREKGCNYCLQTWPDRAAAGVSDIWHGNKLSVGYGVYREIKFCPMCGRRLEVEHEQLL